MTLHVTYKPIDDLIPSVNNTRTHSQQQVVKIAASIEAFGFNVPVLIDKQNSVIAGHGRIAAAKKLGVTDVPTIQLDHLTDTQRKAFMLADNRLALDAAWDNALLTAELASLKDVDFNLDLTGFDKNEIATLFNSISPIQHLTNPDHLPAVFESVVSAFGDLWLLGKHRLLCGDSTQLDDVKTLMADDRADMVFLDPPYNVNYEGYTEDKLTIQQDNLSDEDFSRFLHLAFAACRAVVKSEASLYVCHGSLYQREFQNALETHGFTIRNQIIWAKNAFAWGRGRYKFQHEPIFYCHSKGKADPWYGDKRQSTLWQVDKPTANTLHPTMKPVELINIALNNSSQADDIVLDLFAGSGSTMIACEQTQRQARLVEIDPKYVDVIIRRWQDFTGKEAVLQADSQTFTEIAQKRQA